MKRGFVYLLKEDDTYNYKIGVTRSSNVLKRIKKLQTGNAEQIHFVCCFETNEPFKLEKMLHNRYIGYHKLNEWFDFYEIDDPCSEFLNSCNVYQDNIDTMIKYNNPFF